MATVASVVALLAPLASAVPILMTDAPIDRVLKNLDARLKVHPDDADIHYQIGRAHALAYVTKKSTIRCYGNGEDLKPLPPDCRDYNPNPDQVIADALKPEQIAEHLQKAVEHLGQAIRLKPTARYYLALASVLETAGADCATLDPASVMASGKRDPSAEDHDVAALPRPAAASAIRAELSSDTLDPAQRGSVRETMVAALWNRRDDKNRTTKQLVRTLLTEFWVEQSLDAYFIAHSLALVHEAKVDHRPIGSAGLRISLEAGQGFQRVSKSRPERKGDNARLAIVDAAIKELSKQQQGGGMTPIIFSLQQSGSLTELTSPETSTRFALDGTSRPQTWTWLKPDTGILVWDPHLSGRITSGRQLFGSVSWWIFFDNGYQALDALDDNRDGQLTGDELKGLAVWFDRNSNGISDPGEVIPVESLGISALSCRTTTTSDGCPANPAGLRLTDGRVLPTYDWIATPPAPRPTATPFTTVIALVFAAGVPLALAGSPRRNPSSRNPAAC